MTSKKTGPPRLRISSLDDDNLGEKIDLVLRGDGEVRRRARQIVKLQAELRCLIDDVKFRSYLKLEEAVNARAARALDVVAVWAFSEGLRAHRKSELDDGP